MTASDDVLATKRPGPNVVVHRPSTQDSLTPACPAAATTDYLHFAAGFARDMNASPCHEAQCYPQGWATPDPEGERQ